MQLGASTSERWPAAAGKRRRRGGCGSGGAARVAGKLPWLRSAHDLFNAGGLKKQGGSVSGVVDTWARRSGLRGSKETTMPKNEGVDC